MLHVLLVDDHPFVRYGIRRILVGLVTNAELMRYAIQEGLAD
jgi:hypothetical protein